MTYWAENKDRINANRRKRWKEDAEYRKRQKGRNAQRRDTLREERLQGYLKDTRARLRAAFRQDAYTVRTNGSTLLTVRGLAWVLERSMVSVQQWLSKGVLPGYTERHGRYRLFDRAYCGLIVEAMNETLHQNLRGNADIFRSIIARMVRDVGLEVICGKEKGKGKGEKDHQGRKSA